MNEMIFSAVCDNADELYHHGILGQKWGVRRFQPYPSGYSGDGKYVGKSSTQSGDKPTLREKVREYAKSGHALDRGRSYSIDRRIANRAERVQRGFVNREQKRYDKAVKKGDERKIKEHEVKLAQEKKTREALETLQQELTNQINASFITGRTRRPISANVTKFFQKFSDICSDIPVLSTFNLGTLSSTYGMRRVVQNAIEESNVMGKKLDDVIQQNLREEIHNQRQAAAQAAQTAHQVANQHAMFGYF